MAEEPDEDQVRALQPRHRHRPRRHVPPLRQAGGIRVECNTVLFGYRDKSLKGGTKVAWLVSPGQQMELAKPWAHLVATPPITDDSDTISEKHCICCATSKELY